MAFRPNIENFISEIKDIDDKYSTHSDIWKNIYQKEQHLGSTIKQGIESGWFLRHWALCKSTTTFEFDFQKDCYFSTREVRTINSHANKLSEMLAATEQAAFERTASTSKQKAEHFKVLAFLKNNKLDQAYLKFLETNGLFSNFATARAYIYARWIWKINEIKFPARTPNVLEIGAGSASTLIILGLISDIKEFTIVDLPEMLPFAAYWIDEIFGNNAEIKFFNQENSIPKSKLAFTLLTPDQIKTIDSCSVQLILNINSFMEMDAETLEFYFANIYRVADEDALFINVNRIQAGLKDSNGKAFFNHPLYYPYGNDEPFLWDIDPVQQATRSSFMKNSGSTAFFRAAVVKPRSDRKKLLDFSTIM